ncbi:hypothetical protein H6F88_10740 [Oculatella sp. FACHB-28]|uniref:hypothetical protein n=1 Tax=Cyanophyceae TaxID=3028117 RepID=UPI0016837C2E|nr:MULTISPECIES: hypothetical protein [Cyanophyceae]MBD2000643.1 hypothetical protein [Leptolyngbya sp. FACHB-541]MBD2056484.1 hypothetical protein [Oculatella sp. FACHB-28]
MKKVGFIVFAILLGVGLGALAAISLSWQQATQLPEWYDSQKQATNLDATESTIARDRIIRGITTTSSSGITRIDGELNATDINQLVVGAIATNPNYRPVLEGTRDINTTIQNGQVQSGAVVNLSEIPTEQLNPTERALLERLSQTFPALADREIYLGIEGQPSFEQGRLLLSEDTVIRVGDLRLTLDQLQSLFGVSREQIEQQINQKLQQEGLDLSTVEFQGDSAVVRGEVRSP